MSRSITIHYSEEGRLHAPLAKKVAASGVPTEAHEIYRGRNVVATIPSAGITANIKAFALPNIVNRFVYGRFRKGKARRSFENSLRLLSLGFNVPDPLAYIEEQGPISFRHSYFISKHIDGLVEMRHPERHPFMKELLDALGREMARLHSAGVWMKDFSPGNILFRRHPDGSFEFWYVDLNRIIFDTFNPDHLDLMWERLLFDPIQIAIASASYARAMGRDPERQYAIAIERNRRYCKSRNYKPTT